MGQYIGAKDNEVFLGNVRKEEGISGYLVAAGLQTLRLGDQALDINGGILPTHQPLFIGRSESDAYDRIMIKRFKKIK